VVVAFHDATLITGRRYPFPGPDFHRLDRASFAWRTATLSSRRTCTDYLLPVSRRTPKNSGHYLSATQIVP
jgi:hypothetical protein